MTTHHNKRSVPLLIGALALSLWRVAVSDPAQTQVSRQYHGFTVDFAQLNDSPTQDAIWASVQKQIDIVEAVGLAKEDVAFFRTVPLIMLLDSAGTPGIYSAQKKLVFLKGKDLDAKKPILLHELLHAYHDQKLPQGYRNSQVLEFYVRALQVYPQFQNSYFLKNGAEFFAVTASIHLFGDIARAPYNRKTLRENQPIYCGYLVTLFGEKK